MNELGQSVCRAIDFLDEFFKDVSKLLTNIEQSMASSKLLPYGDAATFWYHSRAYYSPHQWLPRYFARIYVSKDPSDSKPDKKSKLFAFFNACLKPINFDQPIAVWGIGQQAEKKDIWHVLDSLGLFNVNNPILNFVSEIQDEKWQELKNVPVALSDFKFRSNYLIELNNSHTAKEKVIDPLLEELKIFTA